MSIDTRKKCENIMQLNNCKKYAVFSMDVEDWFINERFAGKANSLYSMLDGVTVFMELLNKHKIKGTFFALADFIEEHGELLRHVSSNGHEIACHGKSHQIPLRMGLDEFEAEIVEAKRLLSDFCGKPITGYRASTFGIDEARFDVIGKAGFKYSASLMNVKDHPWYGQRDLSLYTQIRQNVFLRNGVTEFGMSTQPFLGKSIAVSGGGWIRIMPWNIFMKPLTGEYLKSSETYSFYIHPWEVSRRKMPRTPEAPFFGSFLEHMGNGKVESRIEKLINMLKEQGYEFLPYEELRLKLTEDTVEPTVLV